MRVLPRNRLKALYKIGELAELLGMSKQSALRLLRRNRVLLIPRRPKRGETVRVSIASLGCALPDLAEGLRLMGAFRPRTHDDDELDT